MALVKLALLSVAFKSGFFGGPTFPGDLRVGLRRARDQPAASGRSGRDVLIGGVMAGFLTVLFKAPFMVILLTVVMLQASPELTALIVLAVAAVLIVQPYPGRGHLEPPGRPRRGRIGKGLKRPHGGKWRRRSDSNRCIEVLQTSPLTTWVRRPEKMPEGGRLDRDAARGGCPSRIRTSVNGSKVRCPTTGRRGTGRAAGGMPSGPTGRFGNDEWSGRRGSNPRPQPWQGCALPTAPLPPVFAAGPVLVPRARIELATPRFSVACSTN